MVTDVELTGITAILDTVIPHLKVLSLLQVISEEFVVEADLTRKW